MLTSSPVLTSSAGTSPVISFRHAHQPHTYAHTTTNTHVTYMPDAHHSEQYNAVGSAVRGDSSSLAAAVASGAAGPIPRRPSSLSTTSSAVCARPSAGASMKSPPMAPRPRHDERETQEQQQQKSGDTSDAVSQPKVLTTSKSDTAQNTPLEPPSAPCPEPVVKTSSSSAVATPLSQSQASTFETTTRPTAVLSPNKRRGSPGLNCSRDTASADATDPGLQSMKRSKAEDNPPKILPQKYELCAVEDIVELIAYMLAELITTNDAIRVSSSSLTRFHSRTAPGISVRDYLHRLAKHATLTPPLLLAMVYYIDRLCLMYQDFTINTLTVHRFLITAATVAAKGLSDAFWNNATYARVGGVRLQELKLLELEFLHRVDWKIVPNPEVLVAYYQGLVDRTPGYDLELESSSSDEDLSGDGDDE